MSQPQFVQTGPYLHAAADRWTKVFKQPGRLGTRTFTVLIAVGCRSGNDGADPRRGGDARHGAVDLDGNGVVVLDADNLEVVIDQMERAAPDVPTPTAEQRALAGKILRAPWGEFAAEIALHPRYRDSLETGPVQWVQPIDDNRLVLSAATVAAQRTGGVDLVAVRRLEILDELMAHEVHRERNGPAMLAWAVATCDYDTSGKGWPQIAVDPAFDEAWAAYRAETLARNPGASLHTLLQDDAMHCYLRGDYATHAGTDRGHYQFGTQGDGGWLVLGAVKGVAKGAPLEFDSRQDMHTRLSGLGDAALAKLYLAVRNLDCDLSPRSIRADMSYRFALLRQSLELDGSLDGYRQANASAAPYLAPAAQAPTPARALVPAAARLKQQ